MFKRFKYKVYPRWCKLPENAYPDKYAYSGYGTRFHERWQFSVPSGEDDKKKLLFLVQKIVCHCKFIIEKKKS